VEPGGGPPPQMSLLVLEKSAHLVARERVRPAWIVAKRLHDAPVEIQPVEPAVDGGDPEGAAAALKHLRDGASAQRGRITGQAAEMAERVSAGLELIQALIGTHPEIARAIEH